MERANSKHGRALDEALKHETEGLVRAARSTHAEEWVEPEPSGEDQPMVSANPEEPLVGGVPPGLTAHDIGERSTLATYFGKTVYPAGREQLLERLRKQYAPDRLIYEVSQLPADREFHNLREIAEALGLEFETNRF